MTVTSVKSGISFFHCYLKPNQGGILGSSSSMQIENWAGMPFFLTCVYLFIIKIYSVTTVTKNKKTKQKTSNGKGLNHVTASNKNRKSVTMLLQSVTICYIVAVTFFWDIKNCITISYKYVTV